MFRSCTDIEYRIYLFSSCTDTEYIPGSSCGPVYPDLQLCDIDQTTTTTTTTTKSTTSTTTTSATPNTVVLLGGRYGKDIYTYSFLNLALIILTTCKM